MQVNVVAFIPCPNLCSNGSGGSSMSSTYMPSRPFTLHSAVEDSAVSEKKGSRSRRGRARGFAKTQVKENSTRKPRTYKDIKEIKTVRQEAFSSPRSSSRSAASTKISSKKSNEKPDEDASRPKSHSEQPTTHTDVNASTGNDEKSSSSFQHFDMKKRLHNIHDIRSSRTGEERKRSSDRISKAQMLLDDFSSDPAKTSPKTGSVDNSAEEESSSVGGATTVPDNFWYNGNLQQGNGDYVTRWARGVKVAEPLRKYDPIATEKSLFLQPTKWLVRNVQIGFPLALWAVGVASDVVLKKEEENRRNRAQQLLRTISGLGPAIIKGGQALSSRSDLMPSEYLEELQKLQDDVPRFQNEVAFATVEDELGMEFDAIFELIGTEPVAAASIGQVYKARLRSNGQLVAIKIQRPKCEEVIALDLFVLRWWSGVANFLTQLLNRDIDVQSIIDDFGELVRISSYTTTILEYYISHCDPS